LIKLNDNSTTIYFTLNKNVVIPVHFRDAASNALGIYNPYVYNVKSPADGTKIRGY